MPTPPLSVPSLALAVHVVNVSKVLAQCLGVPVHKDTGELLFSQFAIVCVCTVYVGEEGMGMVSVLKTKKSSSIYSHIPID